MDIDVPRIVEYQLPDHLQPSASPSFITGASGSALAQPSAAASLSTQKEETALSSVSATVERSNLTVIVNVSIASILFCLFQIFKLLLRFIAFATNTSTPQDIHAPTTPILQENRSDSTPIDWTPLNNSVTASPRRQSVSRNLMRYRSPSPSPRILVIEQALSVSNPTQVGYSRARSDEQVVKALIPSIPGTPLSALLTRTFQITELQDDSTKLVQLPDLQDMLKACRIRARAPANMAPLRIPKEEEPDYSISFADVPSDIEDIEVSNEIPVKFFAPK